MELSVVPLTAVATAPQAAAVITQGQTRVARLARLKLTRRSVSFVMLAARKDACDWAWCHLPPETQQLVKAGRLTANSNARRFEPLVLSLLRWGNMLAGVSVAPASDPQLEALEVVTDVAGFVAWEEQQVWPDVGKPKDRYQACLARLMWVKDVPGQDTRVATWIDRTGVSTPAMLEELRLAVAALHGEKNALHPSLQQAPAPLTALHVINFKANTLTALAAAEEAVVAVLDGDKEVAAGAAITSLLSMSQNSPGKRNRESSTEASGRRKRVRVTSYEKTTGKTPKKAPRPKTHKKAPRPETDPPETPLAVVVT
jgi:hypothetical protein